MMQNQYVFSAFEADVVFLPLTIINFIVVLQVPKLTDKFGNNKVLLIGELILITGLILLLHNPIEEYLKVVFVPMMLIGMG